MSNQNRVSPNCMVIMDLSTELENSKQLDVAKGVLIGGLLGMGLTSMDRSALGGMLAALHLKQEKDHEEIRKQAMGIINFSKDEQLAIQHILIQAHIIDDKGNLIG